MLCHEEHERALSRLACEEVPLGCDSLGRVTKTTEIVDHRHGIVAVPRIAPESRSANWAHHPGR